MADFGELLDERIDAILERHGVPGAAIGIRHAGTEILRGFGHTSVANPLPVDPDTIFQVGSISKTLLGFIIGKLLDEAEVGLDDPVAPLLDPESGIDPRITLRHTITHTSGIDAQNMIADAPNLLAGRANDSIQASLRHFARRPLLFEPGSDFSYSGPGIMVAAAVVERVTGRAYADVLRDTVLVPAGMEITCTTADEAILRRVAAPHGRTPDGEPELLVDRGWQRHWQLPGWDVPGGGVLSTARELMRYARFVTSDAAPSRLFEILADRGPRGEHIGLAWHLDEIEGHPSMSHDGLTIGYASRLVLVPALDLAYTVLTNSLEGGGVVAEIDRLIKTEVLGHIPGRTLSPVPAELAEALAGTYDCGFYGTMTVAPGRHSGELRLIANAAATEPGQYVIDLESADRVLQCAPDALMIIDDDGSPVSDVPFVQDRYGRITAIRWHGRIAHRTGA